MKRILVAWAAILFFTRWWGMWLITYHLPGHRPMPLGWNLRTFLADWNCDEAPAPWFDSGVWMAPICIVASFFAVAFITRLSAETQNGEKNYG